MREMEALTADAVVSQAGQDSAQPSSGHVDCLNCGAHLHGRYCHGCGQSIDDHHRSIGHLIWEAVEGFSHLDGRIGQTVPALLFRPGRLARDYIEGRRERHVPPFRLFLISLLVFMFSAEWALKSGVRQETSEKHVHAVAHFQVGQHKVQVVRAQDAKLALDKAQPHDPLGSWLHNQINRAAGNREFYLMLVFEWGHRLAVLMLPILAALLSIFYFYRKRLYIYDHLMVAMQYLSFCFLVWAPVWISPEPVTGWLFSIALAWTPFNLYLILRTAYGSRRIGAAAKAMILWLSTVTAFGLLLTGILLYALNQL